MLLFVLGLEEAGISLLSLVAGAGKGRAIALRKTFPPVLLI